MEKENFNPLVYDSRVSEAGVTQNSTFASFASPFPSQALTKTEKKFGKLAHSGSAPDDIIAKLRSEVFDMSLHIYHLQEKLKKVTNGADLSADLNRMADLEARVDSLTHDLEAKNLLLREGADALAQLDSQLAAARRERDLSQAAHFAAAAERIVADEFFQLLDDGEGDGDGDNNEAEVGEAPVSSSSASTARRRLAAVKAESLGLGRRCAAMRDRLVSSSSAAAAAATGGVREEAVEFSDRLSSTEALLASAKMRLQAATAAEQQQQQQHHNASM